MPKISPKSVLSQNSQNKASAHPKAEKTESELLFAALFGGAANELSPKKVGLAVPLVSGKIAASPPEQSDFEQQSNSELLTLIATVQSGRALDQKIPRTSETDSEDDFIATEPQVFLDEKNSEAIGLSLLAGPVAQTIYGSGDSIPTFNKETIANMLFDEKAAMNSSARNRSLAEVSSGALLNGFPNDRQTLRGLLGSSGDVAKTTLQAQPIANAIGSMSALQTDVRTVNDWANLRGLRASNLDQQNAEIDTELLDAEAGELIGKSEKKITTAASLKQTAVIDGNLPMESKLSLSGEKAQRGGEMMRGNTASLASVDNVSTTGATAANSSLNGQAGGQNGQQNNGQPGTPTGGTLLNNLNVLQTLDTAKGNWAEMLMQRVQRGLSGGKDQLDFQLNPRNLGKMRITLLVQNDRTSIQIRTETSAAASMLSESEARLAQMLEASGLRLGNLSSGQFQGFGGNASDQRATHQDQAQANMNADAQSTDDEGNGESLVEANTSRSENLINIQA